MGSVRRVGPRLVPIEQSVITTLFVCTDTGIGMCDVGSSSSTLSGPVFLKEPANRIDFSNTTGTVIECAATGNPRPEIVWIKADGSPVTDVPGLRQVRLVFTLFCALLAFKFRFPRDE